nr:uncharacterized protein LOC113724256 [Coffea arabica]
MKDGNGVWTEEPSRIEEMAITFFEGILSQPGQRPMDLSMLEVIPSVITMQDNMELQQFPTEEEVKAVVFQLDGGSSPGAELSWGYTATWLALIPKTPEPSSSSNFRLISLCNFINKIISKLLARRLERVLPRLISQQQSGFVKGRQISDNILLALEMCSASGRKVMRRFGFGEQWLDMVWRLISSCHFSVLVNGKPCGFFRLSRGLRQGDPLSPALFIIAAEVLSRSLNELPGESRFAPFFVTRECPPFTHLAYADDVIIFSNGGKRSLGCVMRVLEGYQVTGFPAKSLPVTYLGCPLFRGRRVKSLFAELLSKFSHRIASWQGRWLSMSARALLIKHVLSSMPIHMLAVLEPPMGVISDLERMLARFFWGESEFGAKCHWAKWEKLCFPEKEGGVGFRSLQAVVEAFSCKLWWMFRCGQSLWAKFMRARYFGSLHPNQAPFPGQLSASCKRMLVVRSSMEQWLKWDLSRGEVAFWWDN